MTQDRVPLADPGADPGDPLLRRVLADFLAARTASPPCDVGGHWNRFRPDFDRLIRSPAIWPRFRRFAVSYGFDDSLKAGEGREVPALKPSLYAHADPYVRAWTFDLARLRRDIRALVGAAAATLRPEAIARLGEPAIGDPPAQRFADFEAPVDLHDLSMVHFAVALERALAGAAPRRVLEIGGGYGALAAKLRRRHPGARLVLVDLPETSAVQQIYLAAALPGARLVGYAEFLERGAAAALEAADVLLLPPAAVAALPDGAVDLAINIRSLPEMSRAYADFYVREVQRMLAPDGTFFCANALAKVTSGETVRLADLPFDDRWRLDGAEPVPWQRHIRALVLRRGAEPDADWRTALAELG